MNTNRRMVGILLIKERLCIGTALLSLCLTSCVINTNVAVTKESVVVQNNISVSEKILNLFFFL